MDVVGDYMALGQPAESSGTLSTYMYSKFGRMWLIASKTLERF